MDRALDLKPKVVGSNPGSGRKCTTEVRPLSKAPAQGDCSPTAPRALQCRLPTAPLGWVKCREHISLLIILCIIVYVTNKAHLSLICICCITGQSEIETLFMILALLVSRLLVLRAGCFGFVFHVSSVLCFGCHVVSSCFFGGSRLEARGIAGTAA